MPQNFQRKEVRVSNLQFTVVLRVRRSRINRGRRTVNRINGRGRRRPNGRGRQTAANNARINNRRPNGIVNRNRLESRMRNGLTSRNGRRVNRVRNIGLRRQG